MLTCPARGQISKDVARAVNSMSGGLSMLVIHFLRSGWSNPFQWQRTDTTRLEQVLLIFWIPTTIVFLIDAQVLSL